MPQITLQLSHNINISKIDFEPIFSKIHEILGLVPGVDNRSCFGGVVQEAYSYIGVGDQKQTKAFLDIRWLEDEARYEMKKQLASDFQTALAALLVPAIEQQGLLCKPRIRITNLGELNRDYFISP